MDISPETVQQIGTAIGITASAFPATKLIKTVSGAIGMIWEPYQLKRMKRAEAEAENESKEIKTLGELDLQEKVRNRLAQFPHEEAGLALRESLRTNYKEFRRQQNIENIVRESARLLPEHVSDQPVDEDWVFQFFESCQDVSNDRMRIIWAKILAGEVAKPESFSIRTLNFVRMMSQSEAELFHKFCNYLWQVEAGDNSYWHINTTEANKYLNKIGINYLDRGNLQSLGLLQINGGFRFDTKSKLNLRLFYGEKGFAFKPNRNYTEVVMPALTLTPLGAELAKLREFKSDGEYLAVLQQELPEWNIELEEINSEHAWFKPVVESNMPS